MISYGHKFAVAALVGTFAIFAEQSQPGLVHVVIETSLGTIEADLDSANAPGTVTNFLRYVDARRYDGGRFHRTVRLDNQPDNDVKIEVIQGGTLRAPGAQSWPAIELERTTVTNITHGDGVLSMARGGPNTATSDFFITIGPQHALDYGGKRNADGQGFAAFGKVTKGALVVRAIQNSTATAQNLTPPVTIVRISRKK
ncbi:MAG: peptidylprolyl isomerase [Phycisphaerae bacterium]|nr:peptidylprolyl isomerase [Gemmatimonadaceae bacterium]